MIRLPKLLQLAKHAPRCFWPDCGAYNHGQVVAAHSNQQCHGKGMQIKAHDIFIAYLCEKCHRELDQGKNMSKQERIEGFQVAHDQSMIWAFSSGRISLVVEV